MLASSSNLIFIFYGEDSQAQLHTFSLSNLALTTLKDILIRIRVRVRVGMGVGTKSSWGQRPLGALCSEFILATPSGSSHTHPPLILCSCASTQVQPLCPVCPRPIAIGTH